MTKTALQIVQVELGDRSYPIRIGGALKDFGAALDEVGGGKKIAVITDSQVGPLHGDALRRSIEATGRTCAVVTLPAGEAHKSIEQVTALYDGLFEAELDRGSWVAALGGGVVGDMAGFVAATYMRGIPFVQIPTTIVAQVDASIGGKTGYNPRQGKNLIGAFHQPRLVYIDPALLRTLDGREFVAGLAEVVKHGVIADVDLFDFMERESSGILELERAALTHIIARSCEYKAYVVSKDERESGLRATLNYGHTVGHALEKVTGYTGLLHGEGVSIGMDIEARVAVAMGLCDAEVRLRQAGLLERLGLPIRPPVVDVAAVVEAMKLDKKTRDGRLNPVLPTRIGHAETVEAVPADAFRRALEDALHG